VVVVCVWCGICVCVCDMKAEGRLLSWIRELVRREKR